MTDTPVFTMDPWRFLRALFDAAVSAASPEDLLPPRLPAPPLGRTVVVGAGKAAAAMARAVDDHWDGPLDGLVVTPYGHALACRRIAVLEAAHPVPDAAGQAAARRAVGLVRGLGPDDLVLALISGGGSSLLALPAPGLTMDDKRTVGAALLRSGATIAEMNAVRKHLSAVKGGRLALAAAPARLVTFLISDVPGDDPSTVASGPTVGDPTTFAEAIAVLEKYEIEAPAAVLAHLRAGAAGGPFAPEESPKPGDPRLGRSETIVLAASADALAAAAEAARAQGARPLILGVRVVGEAAEVGRRHALLAARLFDSAAAGTAPAGTLPAVLLSGGETTVTVRGDGRGGRNTEYLLGLALELGGHPGVYALAADTDGIDGTEDNAGAFISPDTLARAAAAGLDAAALLWRNDAYSLFAGLGDLLVTGPTRTNVNDLRAVLVLDAARAALRRGRLSGPSSLGGAAARPAAAHLREPAFVHAEAVGVEVAEDGGGAAGLAGSALDAEGGPVRDGDGVRA